MTTPTLPARDADAGAQRVAVRVRRDGAVVDSQDWLADEVPVALIFNGISHAVMLATPLDLEDFALGFGLTEGLLARADELYGVELVPDPAGVRIEMEVASACFARLKDRRRSIAWSRSSRRCSRWRRPTRPCRRPPSRPPCAR
jgi:FdhD protein